MPTIYELLGRMGGQQKLGFDFSKLNIKKIFEKDKRALQEYDIALQEAASDRERDIKNQRSRGVNLRGFGKVLDFITGTPIGSTLSNVFQGVTKDRRFTSSNPFGEKVADPYRDLDVDRPETTFLSTAGKRLDSKAKTISDFISNAETQFDEGMIPNLITDLITSGQTKSAGFTPDYLKDIFGNIKEGGNFFDAFKAAEETRRAKILNKTKSSLTKKGASSIDSGTFNDQTSRFVRNKTSLLNNDFQLGKYGANSSNFNRSKGLMNTGFDPRKFSNTKDLFKSFNIDGLDQETLLSDIFK
jgi:hypothetical protein